MGSKTVTPPVVRNSFIGEPDMIKETQLTPSERARLLDDYQVYNAAEALWRSWQEGGKQNRLTNVFVDVYPFDTKRFKSCDVSAETVPDSFEAVVFQCDSEVAAQGPNRLWAVDPYKFCQEQYLIYSEDSRHPITRATSTRLPQDAVIAAREACRLAKLPF